MSDFAGFGIDLHAALGMRFRLVSGGENLAIALFRRLTTPRGGLFYDPSYGTDMRSFLNRFYNEDDNSIQFEIEQRTIAEVLKDPRVFDAGATFEPGLLNERKGRLIINIMTARGPFRLVLSAESLTSEVIRIENAK